MSRHTKRKLLRAVKRCMKSAHKEVQNERKGIFKKDENDY